MELRNPLVLLFIFIGIICYVILSKTKKEKNTNEIKVANIKEIQNTKYYQEKLKKFKIIVKITKTMCIISIISCSILIARPTKIDTLNNKEQNRDIFLCMDVSTSVDELNKELVENFKTTVNNLTHERFGISIFNTSSITLTPLTKEKKYIINILENIKDSIEINTSYSLYNSKDYLKKKNYIVSGTLEENETKGSSLIGDGLASCIYNFPNLEEKRSRIIILSTDNDLAGTPLLTLDEATTLGKEKGITIFGIGIKTMEEQKKKEMKEAIEKTGGKFYEHSKDNVKNIINDIEKTTTSLLENKIEKQQIDIPEIPFLILLLSISILIILNKEVIS